MHKTHSRACYPAAGGLDFGMRMVRTISRSVSCRSRGGGGGGAAAKENGVWDGFLMLMGFVLLFFGVCLLRVGGGVPPSRADEVELMVDGV